MDEHQPIYYAVWIGTPDMWSYLYTTTTIKRDAELLVRTIAQFGRAAYYTIEQGPIVPLGGSSA
jgi:hypothetical protein